MVSKHDFWHLTLTYNHNLAKVKVNLHAEYQGHRSNSNGVRMFTDKQTVGRYQVQVDNDLTASETKMQVTLSDVPNCVVLLRGRQ